MANLSRIATAETYAAALHQVTGTPATARHAENYSTVYFTDPRATQAWIRAQLRPGKAGEVRLDLAPVVLPVAAQYAVPVALAVFALGYFLGRSTK
jgi:hypothetical protein